MVIYMMVSGIIRDKGILLAAFLLLLSSCGSRRAANYNGHHIPVQVTDVGGRVIPSPRVSSRKAVPATWRDNVQARLDALCRQPLLETSQLGLYVYDLGGWHGSYVVTSRPDCDGGCPAQGGCEQCQRESVR